MATTIDLQQSEAAKAYAGVRYNEFLGHHDTQDRPRWEALNVHQQALFMAGYVLGLSDHQTGRAGLARPLAT